MVVMYILKEKKYLLQEGLLPPLCVWLRLMKASVRSFLLLKCALLLCGQPGHALSLPSDTITLFPLSFVSFFG